MGGNPDGICSLRAFPLLDPTPDQGRLEIPQRSNCYPYSVVISQPDAALYIRLPFARTIRESFGLFEPIRKVLESDESDVIPCWALDSVESARCGSLDSALSRTAVAFVTRAI